MCKWSDFYYDRLGEDYSRYCKNRYQTFLLELLSIKGARTYRDEGCGIGTISKCLLEICQELSISLVDNSRKMLELAKSNVPCASSYIISDIRGGPNLKADVVFGHGVLEHFYDLDILKILSRQIENANKAVLHYVPTNGYKFPSFGDERLLPVDYWVDTFSPTRYKSFNEDRDLVLIWERE